MINKRINITQKNLLLFLYIIILGLFGPALYWLSNSDTKIAFPTKEVDPNPIQKRISIGEKLLVTAHNNIAKQAGIEAFANSDYLAAYEHFNSALRMDRNDPESLIYLNNAAAAKTEAPYKIGVSVPIGGNLNVAQEILRGVAQAQHEINQNGGLNGKLVMVEIANDDNDNEIAQEIASKFVRDKKILAVVGHNSSNVSIAAAPIYEEGGVVMITPTSSAEALPTLGNHIFRTSPSTRGLADILADYTVNVAGKTNIGVCLDSDARASVSFKENFTWAVYNYGGKITPLDCDLAAENFSGGEIPSQAISKGADALLLAASVRRINEAVAVVKANDDRLTLLGNHSLYTYAALKDGKSDINGMVLSVPWHPQPKIKTSFSINAGRLWGGSVNWRTATAYDASQTIFQALIPNSNRQQLQQTLTNPNFAARGATSEISFLPSGDRNLRGTLIKVEPGKRSGTGFDFVALDLTKSTKTLKGQKDDHQRLAKAFSPTIIQKDFGLLSSLSINS